MFFFWVVAVNAFILSYAAKVVADMYLHERIALLGRLVGLLPAYNPGIAFGVQFPRGVQECLILIALGLVMYVAFHAERSRIGDMGYGLIVGGAMGNICDRFMDGLVTDFFQIGTFPIFNVADSCITIGVIFLLAQSFISGSGKHLTR